MILLGGRPKDGSARHVRAIRSSSDWLHRVSNLAPVQKLFSLSPVGGEGGTPSGPHHPHPQPLPGGRAGLRRTIHPGALLCLTLLALLPTQLWAETVVGATPGELAVDESGAATYTIPIQVPPGIAGMEPSLALVYNSQAGNGLLGVGWSLSGLSAIHRCPRTIAQDGINGGVNFDANDRFCLDGQRLVAVNGAYGANGTEYRTEVDSFTRTISYGTAGSGPAWFKVWTKSGQVMEYGNTDASRIEAQGRADVRVWAVNRISDTVGNYLTFTYVEDNARGEYYPNRVDYAGNEVTGTAPSSTIAFVYEGRSDKERLFAAGSQMETSVRLAGLEMFVDSEMLHRYRLKYSVTPSASTGRSILAYVDHCDQGGNSCLPGIAFESSAAENSFLPPYTMDHGGSLNEHQWKLGDFNGDGKTDLIVANPGNDYWVSLSTGNGWALPYAMDHGGSLNEHQWQLGDFNGDGKTDLMVANPGNDYWVSLSTGDGWALPYAMDHGGSLNEHQWQLGDFNGDGKTDLMVANPGNDYWVSLSTGSGWAPPYVMDHGGSLNEYQWQLGDFNGDGKTDLIVANPGNDYWVSLSTGNGWAPPYVMDHGGSLNEYQWQLGDFNGDGKTDLIVANPGNDYWVSLSTGNGWAPPYVMDHGGSLNEYQWQLGDFNGDGKTDLIVANPGNDYWVSLSTGNGWVLPYAMDHGGSLNEHQWQLGDFNGDGKTDLMVANPGNDYWVSLSTGDGWALPYAMDHGGSLNEHQWQLGDFNGDGKTDLMVANPGNDYWVSLTDQYLSDLLNAVVSSLGVTTTVTHSPITDNSIYSKDDDASYPEMDLQAPLYVVSEVSTDDGIGGQRTTSYTYGGAKLNLHGRGFLGFRWMEATDQDTGIVTTTEYEQDFPYTGQVAYTEQRLGDTLLKRSENLWAAKSLNAGKTQFPYLAQSVAASYELNHATGSAPVTVVTADSAYDDWGNPKEMTVTTEGGGETFVKATLNDYTNNTDLWHLGRLTRAQVTASHGMESQTRVSSFDYHPVTGLLSQETIEPGTAFELVTDYTYDAFGNKRTATISGADILTRTSTTDYGPDGRFPLTTTNALGHSETKTYDGRFGQPKTLTGPNGLITTWTYGDFGRKKTEHRADGTQSTWTYAFCDLGCPTHAVYKITETTTGTAPVTVYYDRLNRDLRSESTGFDGRPVYQDTVYNYLGQVEQRSRPYYAGETPHWSTLTYDAIGRLETETAADLGLTEYSYNGLATTVTNALEQGETRTEDALGRLVQVTDAAGGKNHYEYDPSGNLKVTWDAEGNPTAMTYDIRGRKRTMDDPDMGHWEYDYNVLGELVWQQDAKGQVVEMDYDALGRMVTRLEADGTTTWQWEYDTAAKGIGKPAHITGPNSYLKVFDYDTLGRPSATHTTIAMETFTVSRAYDGAGRVETLTYPTGFGVRHLYTASGHLAGLRDAQSGAPYWTAELVDAHGQVTQERLGNGITTYRAYDPTNGYLLSIGSGKGGLEVQDLAYGFDLAGNLEWRQDVNLGLTEEFGYDALNRLKNAVVIDSLSGAQASKAYNYTATGNIQHKSDVGDYTYGENAGPHAVTSAGGELYHYDANGSLLSGAGRSVEWTSFNKPHHIGGAGAASTFLYGAERERIQHTITKPTTTTTIKYVGNLYEKVTKSGAPTEHRHHIMAGGQRLALHITKSDGTQKTRYLHSDHLGSITALTDENGDVVERLAYDPHGKRRLTTWQDSPIPIIAQETNRGFTGHEHLDDLGLIHMNGRIYDPTLGRFLSADPTVQFPASTQGFNRYAYVHNNPLSYTDPSGYGLWSKIKKGVKKAWKGVKKAVKKAVKSVKNFVKTYWRPIVAIAAAAVIGPLAYSAALWAAAPISANAFAIAAVAGGAAAGATFAATATLLHGGSVADALQAAAFGGLTGAAFGAIGFHYGSQWTPDRVLAHGAVGGASAELQGGQFKTGFLYAGIAASARYIYNKALTYDVTWERGKTIPGGWYDESAGVPQYDAVFGINRQIITYQGKPVFWANFWGQSGALSKVANYVPGMNSLSRMHDYFQIGFDRIAGGVQGSLLREVGNVPAMVPATAINYAALLDGPPAAMLAVDKYRKR